jgi:hypothetical protein
MPGLCCDFLKSTVDISYVQKYCDEYFEEKLCWFQLNLFSEPRDESKP